VLLAKWPRASLFPPTTDTCYVAEVLRTIKKLRAAAAISLPPPEAGQKKRTVPESCVELLPDGGKYLGRRRDLAPALTRFSASLARCQASLRMGDRSQFRLSEVKHDGNP